MIRVVVVDDSATARALLVAILRRDPEIQVVGEARTGAEGVELTQRLRPQVVTMDVSMPILDGFAATKEIMITLPTPIVIITATMDHRDVKTGIRALEAGAVAVLHKPSGPADAGFDEASRKIQATIKAVAGVKLVRHWRRTSVPPVVQKPPLLLPRAAPAEVVAIATSTGGPQALYTVLSGLPARFSAPILVVQHIAPGFVEGLAAWLADSCALRVKVAQVGEPLLPGVVYLAPDDHHLGISAHKTVALSSQAAVGGFRPSGTYLFESVARAYGSRALAVILTGMGEDGVQGLRAVRQAGGHILAQDEASCVVFGMPGAAVAAGLAEQVLPLEGIAACLASAVRPPG